MLRRSIYSSVLMLSGRRGQLQQQRQFRKTQFLPERTMTRLSEARLAALLLHAFEHVPYYRRQWQSLGITLNAVRERPLSALAALPRLPKRTLRAQSDSLLSDDLASRRWFFNASGGSTGEPVTFVQDQTSLEAGLAVKSLFDEWAGYHHGMRKVLLWGSERDLLVGRETWRTCLGRWARNELACNTFRLSEEGMRAYVQRINRFRPSQILAYAESADELAGFIEREGLTIRSPAAVITSAGTLWPHMRERIERVFGAPVFNRYGSREVGDIACECSRHRGLHLSAMTHHVEILRDDASPAPPGETGEVVVTSLTNRAMPLIRYRIGDRAAWSKEPCACGRNWPLLETVTGRVTDHFVTAQGARIHGGYFTRMLYGQDWIKRFQFIQEEHERLSLLLVPAVSEESAQRHIAMTKPELERKTCLVMGAACRLRICVVKDIAPTPSGKYRYVVSRIAQAAER